MAGGVTSVARYSGCGGYRYALSREWDASAGRVVFVMLNPSTASELRNDPTVERCERRARALGLGGFEVVNLFAFRATRPADLRAAAAPEGAGNDRAIRGACDRAALVIAAWGVHGAWRDAGPRLAARLRGAGVSLHHLGLTRDGHPRHPLYVPYAVTPTPWQA